jgi:hypothetical protein
MSPTKAKPKAAAKPKTKPKVATAKPKAKKPVAKPKAKKPTKKVDPKSVVDPTRSAVITNPNVQASKKMTVSGLGINLSESLRQEIVERAAKAFAAFDKGDKTHVTRCHRVSKDKLTYRLPAGARTVPGQGVIVTRAVKAKETTITLTDEMEDGLTPILGWPSSYGIK